MYTVFNTFIRQLNSVKAHFKTRL